jgi:IS30 family transposase
VTLFKKAKNILRYRQRGANENCNGLLRQYFPRGISFRSITEKTVRRAAERLNMRPRKCLGYQTPAEVFSQALSGALAI